MKISHWESWWNMKNPDETVYEKYTDLIYHRFIEHAEEIKDEITKAIKDAVSQAILKSEDAFSSEKKGSASFIIFSFLYSSFLLKEYIMRLDIFDEDFYLDTSACESDIPYLVLGKIFEKAILDVADKMEKDGYFLGKNQKHILRWKYVDVLKEQLKNLILSILDGEEIYLIIKRMDRVSPLTVMIGDFQNDQIPYIQLL